MILPGCDFVLYDLLIALADAGIVQKDVLTVSLLPACNSGFLTNSSGHRAYFPNVEESQMSVNRV